jgi:hypothetical protein
LSTWSGRAAFNRKQSLMSIFRSHTASLQESDIALYLALVLESETVAFFSQFPQDGDVTNPECVS